MPFFVSVACRVEVRNRDNSKAGMTGRMARTPWLDSDPGDVSVETLKDVGDAVVGAGRERY